MKAWVFVVPLAFALPAPVSAQAWIGQVVGNMAAQQAAAQREHQCMMGQGQPATEIEETRASSDAAMRTYWGMVQANPGKAQLSRLFWPASRAIWSEGGKSVTGAAIDRLSDPFAARAPGGRIEAVPSAYIRSGDGKRVEGYWLARDSAGLPVGAYRALFNRDLTGWRLTELSLVDSASVPASITQYCHKAGDVEPYRIAYAEMEAKRAAKKARKQAERARREAERAAKAGGSR